MKKAMKKALAVLLATLMLLGVGAVGAGASEVTAAAAPTEANKETAIELILGASVDVPGDESAWFKFTPTKNGLYRFVSEDLQSLGNGSWAYLYEEDGILHSTGEFWNSRYMIYGALISGKTYYLETGMSSGDYAVTLEAREGKLVAPKKISLIKGESVDLTKVLKGTTWEPQELYVGFSSGDSGAFQLIYADEGHCTGIYGNRLGKGTIRIMTFDDDAFIEITVKLTGWEWINHYLLFGWYRSMEYEDKQWFWLTMLLLPFTPIVLLLWPFYWFFNLFK